MIKHPRPVNIPLWRSRLKNFLAYYNLFGSIKEAFRYKALRRNWGNLEEKKPVKIALKALEGRQLLIRPGTTDGEVLWEAFAEKSHLPPISLPGECVILDLGANAGYAAAHFASVYPHAKIGVVEMDPGNMALAKLNTEFAKDRCRYLEVAAWSESGTVFYDGDDEKWAFQVSSGEADEEPALNSAQAMTVAEIMDHLEFDYVDYLKMNIEGAEAEILLHDNKWLDRVGSLKLEYHPQFNSHATFANLSKALASANFACARDEYLENHMVAVKKT